MKNRDNIYYWKCDRPEASSSAQETNTLTDRALRELVQQLCRRQFGEGEFSVGESCGQGNHKNFKVSSGGNIYFIRIEDGEDSDGYMIVETEIIRRVAALGIPTPKIFAVDVSRTEFPFSYQIMELFECPDLNTLYKEKRLAVPATMQQLGTYIAEWQAIRTEGFGLFNTLELAKTGWLKGMHGSYPEYYRLNLEHHLDYLESEKFIGRDFRTRAMKAISDNADLLDLSEGCLVHKDIAFWNIIGTENSIISVIDWDDTIMGDPTDDLSLMACYHSWEELKYLFSGYESIRPLPRDFEKRFWLHLLRNMIFKAVIRVKGGYFRKNSDFFLVQSDNDGGNKLKDITLSRLESAIDGLDGKTQITDLK